MRTFFFLMLSALSAVPPCWAANDAEILQRDVATTREVMVAVEGAYVCSAPQEKSNCRAIHRGAQRPLLDRSRTDAQLKAETWLRIPSTLDNADWWVPRKFVIFYSEIPRFFGVWPVRYYYFDTGDSRLLIDFDSKGGFKVKELNGQDGKTYHINGQVYGSQGIYQLRFPNRQNPGVVTEPFWFDLNKPRTALENCAGSKQAGDFCAIGLFSDSPRPVLDPSGKCLRDCKSK